MSLSNHPNDQIHLFATSSNSKKKKGIRSLIPHLRCSSRINNNSNHYHHHHYTDRFFDAVRRGNLQEIQKILLKISPNTHKNNSDTHNNNDTIINSYNPKNGMTPLHIAICYGYDMVVQLLIRHNAYMNAYVVGNNYYHGNGGHNNNKNTYHDDELDDTLFCFIGYTPLHLACHHGRTKIVQILLSFMKNSNNNHMNINDNQKNKEQVTPLHVAMIRGHWDIVQMLLCNNNNDTINVNLKNKNGDTPLQIAAGAKNLEITKLLLSLGANVNCIDNLGRTPLLCCISFKSNIELIQLLLDHGSDINSQDTKGETALHIAARLCQIDVLTVLLESTNYHANINKKEYIHGDTPLHCACRIKWLQLAKGTIQLLLNKGYGIGINIQNYNQEKPEDVMFDDNRNVLLQLFHNKRLELRRTAYNWLLLSVDNTTTKNCNDNYNNTDIINNTEPY